MNKKAYAFFLKKNRRRKKTNPVAKAFYERNDMKLVGKTSWTKDGVKNALPGDIYCYDKVGGLFG